MSKIDQHFSIYAFIPQLYVNPIPAQTHWSRCYLVLSLLDYSAYTCSDALLYADFMTELLKSYPTSYFQVLGRVYTKGTRSFVVVILDVRSTHVP